jgi:adenylylsulfate kinase
MAGNKISLQPCVIFITGLSGAGKTTIAKAMEKLLTEAGTVPVLLDGDEIRKKMALAAFDEHSRKMHNLRVGSTAAAMEKEGKIVIVALIAPYKEIREQIRKNCNNFIEIYLSASIDICIKRDPKGLYKKALTGEIKDFTGISAPYHPPLSPEINIDTGVLNVEQSLQVILEKLSSLQ